MEDEIPIDSAYPVEMFKRDVAPLKVAVVNETTCIVEEIRLLNYLEEYKKEGCNNVEIVKETILPVEPRIPFISRHKLTRLFNNKRPFTIEYPVIPGSTRWQETKGFYEV